MSEWKTWNLRSWNERLFGHFFRSNDERASPVVILLVTADELARAAGSADADADEVRDAFVEAVRAGIRRSKSLLEDASDYRGWPGPPRSEFPPRFVAHLLFTCIAASESSDELGDEGSFVSRLRDLTQDQLPEHSLQMLPRLWEHLAAWLKVNEGRFRPLILPNPGGLTRIGYTVKLAFPDRRDQRQLSDLLDRASLAGHEPPVGRVLSLVGSERNRFRRSFLLAFDEFRRLFESSGGRSAPRLVDHRFWAAVREASLRGRGQVRLSDVAVRLSMLGEEEEDRLALFAVADERTDSAVVAFADLPVSYGPWRFAVVPKAAEALDADQLDRIARAVLKGSLRLPKLSSHVDQGLLPFVAGPHGLLELAGQDQLGEVAIALVRKQTAADFLRVTGNRACSTRPSCYDGWIQVHDPRLRTLPFAELEGTPLSRTWILQQSLSATCSRLAGGIRVDGGWLGVREMLPRVVAPGASALALKGPEGNMPLTTIDDDTWAFPPRDIAGEYALVVSGDGIEDRRTIRFHPATASESFKPASDPEAWIVEEVRGTGTLSSSIPFADEVRNEDCAPFWERAAFLGQDVGVFVASEDLAAWKVVHFAGRFLGARAGVRGDGSIPSRQAASPNARRRWRKFLFDSTPDSSDPQFGEARRRVKAGTSAQADLPRLNLDQSVPDLAPPRLASPSDAAGRLVRIVAGRAAARSGIDWSEWSELTQRVLDIDESLQQRVTRAWMEAGLIDVASCARWWHRAVFARLPRLVAFKIGEIFGTTLSGLALPTTVEEVRRAATRIGMLVEDRFSVSPFVPRTLSLRAPNRRALEDLASACHLRLQWLDLASLGMMDSSRHDGTSAPPEHYERSTRWSRWSLKLGEYPNVTVEHHMRRDRPDYWITSHAGRRVWFYDLNLARAWAAALLGEPVVNAVGDALLEAHHAFLPLPVARALSVLGAGLSGPVDARYRYAVGNPRLREFALDIVSRTFDPSRLAVPATKQATG
ncbi:hypothetical protein BE21_31975 [Sorangium cellulosum]|uniref:Uncharacterized protein n=1 Tax=Sorangium cellulosum TaxID=56 RepID=A0A150TQS7_SORCE|nr:hypothetical protein BE21_31975 [Sorangium cellulosum]